MATPPAANASVTGSGQPTRLEPARIFSARALARYSIYALLLLFCILCLY